MSKSKDQSKSEFVRLFLAVTEGECSGHGKAREILKEEGVNVDKLVSDGLMRIKRMKMSIEAEKTRREMEIAKSVEGKAISWVDDLLNNMNFSLQNVIETEKLTMSFRNVTDLGKEDIREILIKHFTLKFMTENPDSLNGI